MPGVANNPLCGKSLPPVLSNNVEDLELSENATWLFEQCGLAELSDIRSRLKRAQEGVLEACAADGTKPFSCVRRFAFAEPRLCRHPRYPHVMALSPSPRIVDFGCCMGTDICWLVAQGADPAEVTGLDCSSSLLEAGRVLWSGAPGEPCLRPCDLLSPESVETALADRPTPLAVHAGSVLHTFEHPDQVLTVIRAAHALLPKDGVFFGSNKADWVLGAPGELERALCAAGFQNIQTGTMEGSWGQTWFYAERASPRHSADLTTNQIFFPEGNLDAASTKSVF